MFKRIFVICSALSMALSEPPVPQYGVAFNNNNGASGYNSYNNQNVGHGVNNGVGAPITSYGTPNYDNNQGGGHGHDHHDNNDHGYGEPKAYEFGYQVKDDYTGTNYNRQEQSDGNQVTGSYRVALPDGRTQIVTYYADWKTGFHADVRYEGEAQYPETYKTYNNNNNAGGYNYNNNQNYNTNNNNAGYNYNNQGQGQALNNNYNQNQNYNVNQHYNAPNTQYGAPINPIAINNQYAALSTGYGTPNTGAGYDNYNNNQNYNNNYNNNAQQQNNYDSYANSGFGNKVKPTTVYGAP